MLKISKATADFDKEMMRRAIALADKSVENGGGPFGAVIVKDGKVVGEASNCVTLTNDPTAHAEVTAIRKACRKLKSFSLEGCTLYTSCYPCPMCLGAIYWSHISRIFYGNDAKDAAKIGFDDDFIYQELDKDVAERTIPAKPLLPGEAIGTFRRWKAKPDKTEY